MKKDVKTSQSGITSQGQAQVSAHIDWISVTHQYDTMAESPETGILTDDFMASYNNVRGRMGYTSAREYSSGAICMWNEQQKSMGVHVTYSAQAIRYAAENFNLSQQEILERLSANGRISRLDICVDVANVEIDIRKIYTQARDGTIKTRAKQFDYVESAGAGNEIGARTAYIGSMTKRKKLVRVYDKGKQLKLENFLTRFEMETHGLPAQQAGKELLKAQDSMAETIRAIINGYADFSGSVAGKYLASDSAIKLSHPKYQKSDTANWLVGTVAKTLANEVYRDTGVFDAFIQALQFHLENLQAEEQYHGD